MEVIEVKGIRGVLEIVVDLKCLLKIFVDLIIVIDVNVLLDLLVVEVLVCILGIMVM